MFGANTLKKDASAENKRAKVRKYCKQQQKQSQGAFGRMLDITETIFSRFMRGVTSMGSYAYPAVINFLRQEERKVLFQVQRMMMMMMKITLLQQIKNLKKKLQAPRSFISARHAILSTSMHIF